MCQIEVATTSDRARNEVRRSRLPVRAIAAAKASPQVPPCDASGADAKLSEKALRYQVSAAIDLIVQISRFQDGSRRIHSISEVLGNNSDGSYHVVPIFMMSRMVRGADGTLDGRLEPAGNLPSFMEEIVDNGLPFPANKFTKPVAA